MNNRKQSQSKTKTFMGYKNTDSCLQKAFDDERIFVLMARDPTAPGVIMEWVKANIDRQPKEKLIEAIDAAWEMREKGYVFAQRKHARPPLSKDCELCEGSGWLYGPESSDKTIRTQFCSDCKGLGYVSA